MVYASVATGYKGQAYDVSSPTADTGLGIPAKSENSVAFELGLKTSLMDNRVQLSTALFHTDYDDYRRKGLR